ncbi:ATP-binding protein [Streptomyces sp. NRRL S-337]|uniref:ATP-binding protein n=1 Tax=Streptomyces sp. NRRL S-337 TaxID=1463900 RepID=UPI000A9491EC
MELLPGVPRRIRLEVEDRSSQWPRRRSPGETATSGRGLMLVGALAERWGAEPRGNGKALWCEFLVPAAPGR